MLLVNKERLIQLLGHSDKKVRDQSAKALAFFPFSTGIIAPLIQAINNNVIFKCFNKINI